MERVEIAKLKTGQQLTLELGDKEAILTKLDAPKKFNMEDWKPDEVEIYILEDVIEEDEPLHYMLEEPDGSLEAMLKMDENNFGVNKRVFSFFNREVEGIEMEEEEEAAEEG
ncbi:MAG: hypothetical protein HQL50_11510 [Magnetococcales bacterium]|nr:hypothetical protein [Magnetococcales bacterium]